MNLLTKQFILFIALISCLVGNAQSNNEDENEEDNTEKKGMVKDDHYGIFHVGALSPIAFGNSFANEALEIQTGAELEFAANLFDTNVLIGAQYSLFSADVTDKRVVGNYDRSTVSFLGIVLGYHLIMEEHWRAHVIASIGNASYRNENFNDVFTDNALSYSLKPTIGYHINKTLGFYFSGAIRRDNLRIRTADKYNSFFNANYLNLSLGLRLVI